jgi:hypothetical protein
MSGNPGQFKDFNKTANDLLTKVFPKATGANTWGLEFELKPTAYFTGSAKVTNTGGVSTGELGSEVRFSDFGVTFKGLFKTDKPTLEASWKVSDKIPVDGLSAKLHLDATDSTQTAGVSVGYEHKYLTFNGRVYLPVSTAVLDFVKQDALNRGQDTRVDVDFLATHPDHNVFIGGAAKVSFTSGERRLDEANVSVGVREGKFSPSINFSQKLNKDKETSRDVSVILAAKPSDTQYVGQIDYSLEKKTAVATLGLSYPLADGATVKAKVNTAQEVGVGYTNQISSSTQLQFGTLFKLNSEARVSVDSAFTFNLRFTQ